MAQYDSSVLQQYADSLYSKAAWIAVKCAVAGAAVGAILALVLASSPATNIASLVSADPGIGIAVFAIVGGLIGGAIGQRRSFAYRLQAQTVLCQMQIEYNTRRPKVVETSA